MEQITRTRSETQNDFVWAGVSLGMQGMFRNNGDGEVSPSSGADP